MGGWVSRTVRIQHQQEETIVPVRSGRGPGPSLGVATGRRLDGWGKKATRREQSLEGLTGVPACPLAVGFLEKSFHGVLGL